MALKNGPANVSRTMENIVRLIKYLDEEKWV
jgi:glycerate kinase